MTELFEREGVLNMMAGACDCHHHIIDVNNYPIDSSQNINFESATVEDYQELKDKLGIKRNVIISVAAYGYDNRNTITALKKMGYENTRAIITLKDNVTDEELKYYHNLGVRGVRIWNRFPNSIDYMEKLAYKIEKFNWHMCIVPCSADDIVEYKDRFSNLPCQLVFDHMGFIPPEDGIKHKAFDIIKSLILNNQAWVKISGIYYLDKAPEYSKNVELSRRFVDINPDRVLWGTDWPHIGNMVKGCPALKDNFKSTEQKDYVSDILLVKKLMEQVPDSEIRHKILVENPERLYGF